MEISENEGSYDFSWSSSEDASYHLEMDVNEDFAQRTVIASGLTSSTYSVSSDDLNKMIKYLLIARDNQTPSETLSLYFRIKACFGGMETYLVSESQSIEYTYIEDTENNEAYYFIGDYYQCGENGWDFDAAQKLYKQEDGSYKAQIIAYDLSNGWKITDRPDWDGNNWGAQEDGNISDDGIMVKGDGSKDVTEYGNDNNTSYLVTFNPDNGKLIMDNEEKTWRLIGDYNNYSSYNCDLIVKYDGTEGEWYLVPEVGDEKLNYVNMKAGDEWLIRSQIRSLEVLPSNVEGHFEISDNGNKFKVSESGNYEIRWYFNKPKQYIIVIKK